MKTKPDDPVVVTQNANNPLYGLTKREYFAAIAMQGMVSQNMGLNSERHIAHHSVEFADALIERLNKE